MGNNGLAEATAVFDEKEAYAHTLLHLVVIGSVFLSMYAA